MQNTHIFEKNEQNMLNKLNALLFSSLQFDLYMENSEQKKKKNNTKTSSITTTTKVAL